MNPAQDSYGPNRPHPLTESDPLMRPTFLRRTRGALLAAFVAGTMMLSACSSSSGSNSNPDSKEIVAFMPSSANSYFVRYFDQAKAEAADHGYKIKIIENDFDQAEQDQQIQQFIASGERPAAVIFWPSTSEAAVNNARQLSRLAPVVQVGLQVLPEAEDYVAAFEGQDDVTVGEMAGGLALERVRRPSNRGTSTKANRATSSSSPSRRTTALGLPDPADSRKPPRKRRSRFSGRSTPASTPRPASRAPTASSRASRMTASMSSTSTTRRWLSGSCVHSNRTGSSRART